MPCLPLYLQKLQMLTSSWLAAYSIGTVWQERCGFCNPRMAQRFEACYVPLLICQRSIEEIAHAMDAALCVFLLTYERDSIWEFKGAASIEASAIQLPPRLIEVNDRSYRYQEISPNDVLKPLE